ncbi:general stress protein [Listeria sp. PSOL-1]|uniref:general stress protein n=1 Tax=Listeria sp. PSOL-1 TaxID=1844999 RepID=UPI0013D3BF14|nr:general stress protein [Listeria sp. PSOL-1]
MMTFVKEYENDEMLEREINQLKDAGVDAEGIFVLSHDDDRTARIVKNTQLSDIDYNKKALGQTFAKKGDELRAKLKELGLPQEEAEKYEAEMDQGKVFLLVKDEKAKQILS